MTVVDDRSMCRRIQAIDEVQSTETRFRYNSNQRSIYSDNR